MDCEDPECCSNRLCGSSQLCVSSPKPIDILLRKQPPAITASFFERMKFLIDEGSLQNYARPETFNERYVERIVIFIRFTTPPVWVFSMFFLDNMFDVPLLNVRSFL